MIHTPVHVGIFFVSYSHGNEECLCYYGLFSFFHEYHFALNMKHNVKVILDRSLIKFASIFIQWFDPLNEFEHPEV